MAFRRRSGATPRQTLVGQFVDLLKRRQRSIGKVFEQAGLKLFVFRSACKQVHKMQARPRLYAATCKVR